MSHASVPLLPSLRMDDYDHGQVVDYLSLRHARNKNLGFGVCQYTHGVTALSSGYAGGCYSPTQNRIYLSPRNQATQASWHYIDCSTGSVVAYTHGASGLLTNAFTGGVYSPSQNRIYLPPYAGSDSNIWYYIDGATGAVTSYSNSSGITPVAVGYYSGSYSPKQNRVYFTPVTQADSSYWHYVDCNSGSVIAYPNNSGVVPASGAYVGSAYTPTLNRIYLTPGTNGYSAAQWHYIDCSTGSVVAYAHGATVSGSYEGGVYIPTQDRIYLMPRGQSSFTTWHYIDCVTGALVPYAHGLSNVASDAYFGGVYSPTTNRIFLVPFGQASSSVWHYIDCNRATPLVTSYTHGVSAAANAYCGGTYSPTQNRIYFHPQGQANQAAWHFIQEYGAADISPTFASTTLFNSL
jgi:hypothetical protein